MKTLKNARSVETSSQWPFLAQLTPLSEGNHSQTCIYQISFITSNLSWFCWRQEGLEWKEYNWGPPNQHVTWKAQAIIEQKPRNYWQFWWSNTGGGGQWSPRSGKKKTFLLLTLWVWVAPLSLKQAGDSKKQQVSFQWPLFWLDRIGAFTGGSWTIFTSSIP